MAKKKNITLNDLASSIKEGFDGMDKKFDGLEQRLDRIEQRQDEHGRGLERNSGQLMDVAMNQRQLVRTLALKRILTPEEAQRLGDDLGRSRR